MTGRDKKKLSTFCPEKAHKAIYTLNTKILFLGCMINANGVSPDQAKTKAIQKIKPPTNVGQGG